ncbi:methionine synthase [Asanoa sp. NPDC049518]|uniref:methionine synthase n=1 Tax=unclassified Asanoa TaxID=2685164 RepID=UPI00343CE349
MSDPWLWPSGSATGVGSMPGTDIAEAQRVVLGELPDLPHLAELPDRGPGADIIGRTSAFLVDLPVEVYTGRWRIASRPGRDLRRALDLLDRDLDQLTEQGDGYTGVVKVQAAGPYTLAASVDLPIGGRVLRDPGAVRDLTASLAEGLRGYVEDIRRRLPGATVLLQIDEPSLPTVLAGRVPTESGFSAYRPVEVSTATDALRELVSRVGAPTVFHCCGPDAPIPLFVAAGATALSIDLSLVTALDPLGEALDAGVGLLAGVAPTSGARAPSHKDLVDRVRTVWRQLGFSAALLPRQVVVTPTCGLAGASLTFAKDVLAACRDAGRRLVEE